MHPGTVSVENPRHLDFKLVLAKIIKKECLRTAFPFIITRTGTDTVYVPLISFGLGMNCGIAIYL
jgi:hypothetical protein